MSRVNKSFDSACGKLFSKENLKQARKWLHFRGLVVSEFIAGSKPTLAQQIVKYLRNEAFHGIELLMPNGSTIIPKGILLLVAIANTYAIRMVIFSTRKKPLEIIPSTSNVCYTVAFLHHQDSILSIGEWYSLGLVQTGAGKHQQYT